MPPHRRFTALALTGVIGLIGLLVMSVSASNERDCETAGEGSLDVCGDILEYWEANDGATMFGAPLTEEALERDPDTGDEIIVQYFENARLEFHPELANSDYAVQSGRLGSELLTTEGIRWRDMPPAEGENAFGATGQTIAREFYEHWTAHGADLGDDGVSFRESLALHGYPLTPPEAVDDEDIVLVQWFERSRLELDRNGEVTVAPLGVEATESSDRLSVRAEREITATLADIADTHDTPGLGVWLESEQLGEYSWASGEANPETGDPYTSQTHHRVGSITKPFVADLVLQLADEGLISLDDTIEEWFPELDGADEVTIRMLGNMTSGIFNYTESLAWVSELLDDPEAAWEPEDLLRFGFDLTDEIDPGVEWAYSNTNYVMLGLIIEDVTGNPLDDELESRIFGPLELQDTAFSEADAPALPEPYARAISTMGLGSSGQDSTDWNPSWAWAAGQITSTPADMLRWLPEMYRSTSLSDEMRAERFDLVDVLPADLDEEIAAGDDMPNEIGYGYGVLMTNGWYGHDGLIAGYASMVGYHPELEASLVIFSNSDHIGPEGTLASGLAFDSVQRIIEREFPADQDE
jgi:D-alanyl-D-alanine carboxypeptidase